MTCCEHILHWILDFIWGGVIYLAAVIGCLMYFYIFKRFLEEIGVSTNDAGSLAAALAIIALVAITLSMIIP